MVLVLPQNHDDVTLKHVGHLFTLAFKDNFFVISHALHDVHCQCFRLHHNFFPLTLSAVLLIYSALTTTFLARLLHLHLHEAHILSDTDLTLSIALLTCFSLSSLGSTTLAFLTINVPLHREVFLYAIIEFLQRNTKFELIFRSLHSIAATALVPIYLIFALLVIYLPLCIISKHFQRPVDSRELLCRFLIAYSNGSN